MDFWYSATLLPYNCYDNRFSYFLQAVSGTEDVYDYGENGGMTSEDVFVPNMVSNLILN